MKGGRDGVWFWSKPKSLNGDFYYFLGFCDFLKRIRKNCNIFCQKGGGQRKNNENSPVGSIHGWCIYVSQDSRHTLTLRTKVAAEIIAPSKKMKLGYAGLLFAQSRLKYIVRREV